MAADSQLPDAEFTLSSLLHIDFLPVVTRGSLHKPVYLSTLHNHALAIPVARFRPVPARSTLHCDDVSLDSALDGANATTRCAMSPT